jgi:serine/threonine protein kinase
VIGIGASGAVFVAHQLSVDRAVALKVLHSEHLSRRQGLMRFYREARAASLLEHPNIVRVLDFGMDERTHQPYIAMSLVEGRSLSAILEGGPIPETRAARILDGVARALVAAHERHIVHRDLKPENVMVSTLPEGVEHATVLDFGVARVLRTEGGHATEEGMLVGTPAYMSPEQCQRAPADFRSDLYSLGCILHYCLAGAPPFSSDSALLLMMAQLKNAPPPLPERLASGEPPSSAVDALRHWLLEKQPQLRPPSTKIVLEILTALAAGERDRARQILVQCRTAIEPTTDLNRDPDIQDTFEPDEDFTETGDKTEPGAPPDGVAVRTTSLGTIVTMPEVIDERFGDPELIASLDKGPLVFDFDRVLRVTSSGVRWWLQFLKALPTRDYYGFIRCHPSVIAQFNVIEGFGGRGELLSFYVSYECPRCEQHMELLIDVAIEKPRIDAFELPPFQCTRCRVDAEFEESPEVYFHHASIKPRPSPPPAVKKLITALLGRKHREANLTIAKEVQETLTIFRLKGGLDENASFRWQASGVEGDAIVDCEELSSFDQRGTELLAQFLSELECKVHLVGADFDMVQRLVLTPKSSSVRWVTIEGLARCDRCGKQTRARVAAEQPKKPRLFTCCGQPLAPVIAVERKIPRISGKASDDVERYLHKRGSAR